MSDNSSNALEILVNLIYLAKHSADEPQKVVAYLDQAESHVQQLVENVQKPAIG